MAMLLDRPPSQIEDLTVRDSDLLDVSRSEGIDLTAKLQLATAEIKTILESILLSQQPFCTDIRQTFPSLRHIAVTSQLRLWHTYMSLRLAYQDLYYSRLNDRYKAKMQLYRALEDSALDEVRITGLGVVLDPLPQAIAPGVSTCSSSNAGGTMYVATSFVNQKGEEGLSSVPIEVDTQDGTAAVLRLTALADSAVGWNLYAGLSPDALMLQNPEPLDSVASASLAPSSLKPGRAPGDGQHANLLYPIPRRILRG